MVRSYIQNGCFIGFGHCLSISLGKMSGEPSSKPFCLELYEDKLVVVQIDIGQVWDLKYHYHLDFTNTVPTQVKLPHL